MISLRCRPVLAPDLSAVMAFDQACFGGLWSEEGYHREITSPNSDLLILERPDPPLGDTAQPPIGVGCLWAILDEAHITLLGIASLYRRQGLGQWLLLCLLQRACDRGLTHATLEVRASNQPALALYQKYGFQIAGHRRHYYSDGENALVLWCRGLQEAPFRQALQSWITISTQQLAQQGWQGMVLSSSVPAENLGGSDLRHMT